MPRKTLSAEERESRSQAIISSAMDLFALTEYQRVTVASITKNAGIAKGTFFLYFQTKEELFFSVVSACYREYFDWIKKNIKTLPIGHSDELVGILVEGLSLRKEFPKLLRIMHSVLEENISYKLAYQFKKFLLFEIQLMGSIIEKIIPGMKKGEGAEFLVLFQALITGYQSMAEPAKNVRKVIEIPEMAVFKIDFNHSLSAALKLVIAGYHKS